MMKNKGNLLPLLIILAGIAYSFYLVSLIPEGVFFSGDGGLKAMLAQQLSRGEWQVDLLQPQDDWVRQLWQTGLYPYEPPFVFPLNGQYFLSFPFPFSTITAPFYALFGFWGLHIIPLVSCWAIWITALLVCRRLNFNSWQSCLVLIALIFASNLTVYSALYWEHTLAVALAFFGMTCLIIPANKINHSYRDAILGGSLLGLSVWFRSELIALVAALVVLIYFVEFGRYIHPIFNCPSLRYLKKNRELFFLSTFIVIGLFFACNTLIYGRPLGIHALLITENFTWIKRITEAWKTFQGISIGFFQYFPFAILSLYYLTLLFFKKVSGHVDNKWAIISVFLLWVGIGIILFSIPQGILGFKSFLKLGIWVLLLVLGLCYCFKDKKVDFNAYFGLIYGISLLFIIGVALLVDYAPGEYIAGGKQWGNRYVLILLPGLALLAVEQCQALISTARPVQKYLIGAVIGGLLLLGVYQNTILGSAFLAKTYQGVSPAIETLRSSPNNAIAVSHQYAAQMLEPELGDNKAFFRVEQIQDLFKLAAALTRQNDDEFIYVCYPYRDCKIPQTPSSQLQFSHRQTLYQITFSSLGKLGRYPTYKALIKPKL